MPKKGAGPYKGVQVCPNKKTWKGILNVRKGMDFPGKKAGPLHLGTFPSTQLAAHARDIAMHLIYKGNPPEAPQVPEMMTATVLSELQNATLQQKLEQWRVEGGKPFASGSSLYRGVHAFNNNGKKWWRVTMFFPGTKTNKSVCSLPATKKGAELACAKAFDRQALLWHKRRKETKLNFDARHYLDDSVKENDEEVRAAAASYIASMGNEQ